MGFFSPVFPREGAVDCGVSRGAGRSCDRARRASSLRLTRNVLLALSVLERGATVPE
jgi:hypothetical protein